MTITISDNFETRIINELMLAQQSIKIAVAWFNSKNILNILCWKLGGGVSIELILHYDDINSGGESSLDFTDYKRLGGTIIWAKGDRSTMHVKFCIIDDKVLLHGSCNWTNRAFKKNDEVLNVTKDEPEMINSYLSNFASLKEKYTSTANPFRRTGFTTQAKNKGLQINEPNAEVHKTLSVDEKKQLFLQALQPFESKYDKDYIQTFVEYWLAENMGKLRFEIDENGNIMNAMGISSDYMEMKLENWKFQYNIIIKKRQSPLILDEIKKMEQSVINDYKRKNLELQCDKIFNYGIGADRLFGKLLFDRKLFIKQHDEYDSFLQKGEKVTLCCPIDSIEEKEKRAFSVFCLLYEAKQAFKKNKDYNRSILSSMDSQISYRSFCDQYGIRYGHSLKKDKSIKDIIESLHFPIQLEYHYGDINLFMWQDSNQKRLSKLNEVFGLKLLMVHRSLSTYFTVPYKILYQMDGTQFDFRDDSFDNGTMKSVKLPIEYKDAQYYVDKIEEMLLER